MLEKFKNKSVSKEQLETVQGGFWPGLYVYTTAAAYAIGYAVDEYLNSYDDY